MKESFGLKQTNSAQSLSIRTGQKAQVWHADLHSCRLCFPSSHAASTGIHELKMMRPATKSHWLACRAANATSSTFGLFTDTWMICCTGRRQGSQAAQTGARCNAASDCADDASAQQPPAVGQGVSPAFFSSIKWIQQFSCGDFRTENRSQPVQSASLAKGAALDCNVKQTAFCLFFVFAPAKLSAFFESLLRHCFFKHAALILCNTSS